MEPHDTDRVRTSPSLERVPPLEDVDPEEAVQRALFQEQAKAIQSEHHLNVMDLQNLCSREESGRVMVLADETKNRRKLHKAFTQRITVSPSVSSPPLDSAAREAKDVSNNTIHVTFHLPAQTDGVEGTTEGMLSPVMYHSQQWTIDEQQPRWYSDDDVPDEGTLPPAEGEDPEIHHHNQMSLTGIFLFGMFLGVFCS